MLVNKKVISMIPEGVSLSFELIDDIDSINNHILGDTVRKINVDNTKKSVYRSEKQRNSNSGLIVQSGPNRYIIISDYLELDDGDVFSDHSFKFLELSAIDTHRVVSMRGMFRNCSAECIDISGWTTKQVKDTSEMFESASIRMCSLDLTKFDFSSVVSMHAMFRNSVIKNDILVPRQGLSIGLNITDIGEMFDYSDLNLSNNRIVLHRDVVGSDEIAMNSTISEIVIEVLE